MLDHALAIAGRGWPVFPCHPETKQPLIKDGFKKATLDHQQITAWWLKRPAAMIGIPTGRAIGAFVVDVDAGEDKKTGEIFEAAQLQIALEKEIGARLPATLCAATPRGGVHLFFALPDGDLPGNRAGIIKRIDVRGEGGYVIAAPSVRADGNAYRWLTPPNLAIAPAPATLLDLIFRRGKWDEAGGSIAERAAARVRRPDMLTTGIAEVDEAVRKYAQTAFDAEIRELSSAPAGGRNAALNIAAMKLGQLVGAGVLGERMVLGALEDAADACGLMKDDGRKSVLATIASGFRKGVSEPRDLDAIRRAAAARNQRRPRPAAGINPSSAPSSSSPGPLAGAEGKPSSQTGSSARSAAAAGGGGGEIRDARRRLELNRRLALFPLTDLGNAERFRERYRDRLKWCEAIGWLAWDGKRWSRNDANSAVMTAEHDTVRAIQDEARAVRESGRRDVDGADRDALDYVVDFKRDMPVLYSTKLAAWGRSSESVSKLGALSKRGEPFFVVPINQLDADPMKINVANGTIVVDRRRREGDYVSFKPHDPADLITKLAPVDYQPGVEAPEYDAFLARVQPSEEMRRFLHQWGGLSLTGDVTEQKLSFFYGKGGNGKSVLVEAWSGIAGDYGETVPIETFLDHGKARGAGQATPDLAILPGVRMLRTSEPEKNSKLAEAMIKLVTGGEVIQARHLNKDFFRFYPQFKLTMSGNYRPQIDGTDEGIWRRVRLVPFDVSIPKEERDIHLPDKLRAEASGILNRLLDGLRDWCDRGLIEPADVTQATQHYRDVSDPLGRFLETCVETAPNHRVQSSVLHQVYAAWCASSGETAWKNRGFSMALDERGYRRKQSDVVWWLDIKLKKSADDFVDHDGQPRRISENDQQGKGVGPTDAGDIPF